MQCVICHELLTHDEAFYAADDWYYVEPMCPQCSPSEWIENEELRFLDDIEEEDSDE